MYFTGWLPVPQLVERKPFMASRKKRIESAEKKPNILLFAIDSLLADHMSCYGYGRLTTPHMDKLASQGTLFEKTFSPHIPTTPAYSSMLTGRAASGGTLRRAGSTNTSSSPPGARGTPAAAPRRRT
jgi:arylsulfatase A-like enzyme